jgi:hypothetical protein
MGPKFVSLWVKEQRLKVFENKMLMRIYGPKRGSNWEQRKSCNEGLLSMHSSSSNPKLIELGCGALNYIEFDPYRVKCLSLVVIV